MENSGRSPLYGHGIGLRVPHYAHLLAHSLPLDFAEAISENFLGRGGRPRAVLERVRRDVPVVLHGVSLSIGSMDPLNRAYLKELAQLGRDFAVPWFSDHLCFGGYGGHYGHDLWPLPYTEEALVHVVERVKIAQDELGRELLLENVSSYIEYHDSELTEWEFLSEVAERADCSLLLDVNNVYVSARNHGYDPLQYLAGIPPRRVRQLHLAGHLDTGKFLLDNHGSQVPPPVWDLYREVVRRCGSVPTLIEWDDAIPSFDRLIAEAETARTIEHSILIKAA
jgi:uncharacterized protein (UPF0276 family)